MNKEEKKPVELDMFYAKKMNKVLRKSREGLKKVAGHYRQYMKDKKEKEELEK